MPRERHGRYTWRDRLDDRLESLNRFVFGPLAPGESRPGLASSILVWGGDHRAIGGGPHGEVSVPASS